MPPPATEGADAERAGLPMGALASTVVLATITGYVDAFAYVFLFGTFPANQSGNVALGGIAIGQGEWGSALTCLVAVAGFALGVAAGVALGNRVTRSTRRRTRIVLLIELVTLGVVVVAVGALGEGHQQMSGPLSLALLAATSFAMGIQTPVIVRTHGIPTPTTYMTGSVAHMAEAFAMATERPPDREARRRMVRRATLLLIVLVGYVAGAAAGTTVGSAWNLALLVPFAVLALLVVLHDVDGGRGPARAVEPPL